MCNRKLIFTLLITLAIIISLVSYYTHEDSDLPSGMIIVDDIYAGYKLAVPQHWYAITQPITNRKIIGFYLDAIKFHQIGNPRLPISLSALKEDGEIRIFFMDFNKETVPDDFIATGTIIVARESETNDLQLAIIKIKKLGIETDNLSNARTIRSNTKGEIFLLEGDGNTKEMSGYLIAVYFRTDIGLVLIAIISPVDQRADVYLTMNEIIKSIEVFEPIEVPIPGE